MREWKGTGRSVRITVNDEIKKPSFLVYYDNEVIILRLPDEEAGRLFKSLFPYGKEEIKPNFDESPALAMAFDILSMAIDRDKEKYVKRCEANRENGRKGGRPKKNQTDIEETEKTERLDLKPKKADKDMDKDMGRDSINYQQIADMYNDTCVSFPRLTKLSDSRKKAIRARLKQYSVEDFQKLFEMAEKSSFLKGQNARDWSANFDWLIKDSNMAKVLDGNYADKKVDGEFGADSQSRDSAADFYKKYLMDDDVDKKGGDTVGTADQNRGQAADFYKQLLGTGDGDKGGEVKYRICEGPFG